MDGRSDFDLLDLWGGGDPEAGSALYNRHFPSVYRFFRNKAEEGVADLVQRTFLACIEARGRFRRDSSFRTYLFQTARFQLYLHYRELKRNPGLDFSVVTAADLRASPSELIANKQDSRLLLEALRRIPVDHQIVLELSFWEEMSGAEIALELGVPLATARSRLRRAAMRLKAELREVAGSDERLRETAEDLTGWASRVREFLKSELSASQTE